MGALTTVKSIYAAFAAGDIPAVMALLDPKIRWTETAGYKYGGLYEGRQAVLEGVFAKIPEDWADFAVDVERFLDAGQVIVMQGHYVGTGKATGMAVRAAVSHILEVKDGKVVRFDQYVDSATINPVIAGA